MHTNHRRQGSKSKCSFKSWTWYKRRWNKSLRRHVKRYLLDEEDAGRTCRASRHQKTRNIYW